MRYRTISQGYPLVLASNSPRRKEILTTLKIPFVSVPAETEGKTKGPDPIILSRTIAEAKAREVSNRVRGQWVLAADTLVVLEDEVLGKPGDQEMAFRMLSRLSNKTHRVITGLAILDPAGLLAHSRAVVTEVDFKALSIKEIEDYINTGEPMDKAGAYGIQGLGGFMIKGIRGSYTNVVGLPVYELIEALILVGALRSFPL